MITHGKPKIPEIMHKGSIPNVMGMFLKRKMTIAKAKKKRKLISFKGNFRIQTQGYPQVSAINWQRQSH